MFAFLKRARPPAPQDGATSMGDAIAATREALEEGARYLTRALGEIGIDCAQLAAQGDPSAASVSSLLDRALTYHGGDGRYALRLGKTHDLQNYDLEPHYRYREIHLLIEELERLASGNAELRRQRVRQHAAHALIQSRLLSGFLLRVGIVGRLYAANDTKALEQEMTVRAIAIHDLTAALPAPFARGLDLPAIRQEWNALPYIIADPADG
jgi:hypothetical protein